MCDRAQVIQNVCANLDSHPQMPPIIRDNNGILVRGADGKLINDQDFANFFGRMSLRYGENAALAVYVQLHEHIRGLVEAESNALRQAWAEEKNEINARIAQQETTIQEVQAARAQQQTIIEELQAARVQDQAFRAQQQTIIEELQAARAQQQTIMGELQAARAQQELINQQNAQRFQQMETANTEFKAYIVHQHAVVNRMHDVLDGSRIRAEAVLKRSEMDQRRLSTMLEWCGRFGGEFHPNGPGYVENGLQIWNDYLMQGQQPARVLLEQTIAQPIPNLIPLMPLPAALFA